MNPITLTADRVRSAFKPGATLIQEVAGVRQILRYDVESLTHFGDSEIKLVISNVHRNAAPNPEKANDPQPPPSWTATGNGSSANLRIGRDQFKLVFEDGQDIVLRNGTSQYRIVPAPKKK